jgi:hypothetical protein
MKKYKGIMAISFMVIVMINLCTCENIIKSNDPAKDLRGTYLIDLDLSSDILPNTYRSFIVNTNDIFEIRDTSNELIEKCTMKNVTENDFDYTFVVQINDPSVVGEDRYAVWSISGSTLTITFYPDRTKQPWHVVFVCQKQ